MYSEKEIREKIEALMRTSPCVHMDVTITKPRLNLKGAEATVTATYAHIFRIEETSSGIKKSHTLQYADILTRRIVIYELDI